MDEVVIGTIAAVAGTVLIMIVAAYYFFKIIMADKDDTE